MVCKISGIRFISHDQLLTAFGFQLHINSGEPSATLDHPPNTHEFDAVSAHTIVSKSPLLQARVNAMSKERGQQTPVINVVLPNNIGGYPAPAQAPAAASSADSSLLPANLSEGPDRPLARNEVLSSFETSSRKPS